MFKIDISRRVLHFKQPAGTSRGVYTTRLSHYITLTNTERPGVTGIGECAPLPDLGCDRLSGPEEYERKLRALCDDFLRRCPSGEQLLRDGVSPHALADIIDWEQFRPYPSMLFGLETALHQWLAGGKTAFFDTPFSRGEEGITINGLVWMGSFEEMYQRLQTKLDQGFHCVKLKIGAIDWQRELDLVRHIRECFSKEQVELRVDANGGFTPENALERLEALARYDIHSCEQPIQPQQWPAMARLCRESPLPIAFDEELIGVNTREEKERLLDELRPAYIVLKPSLHGGMLGCREWIAMAQARGIGSWITSALESNIGLNAIAQLCADVYGPHVTMAQGLGTGQLFTDNIPMPLEIRGDQLWFTGE